MNESDRAEKSREWALSVLHGDAGWCTLDDVMGPEFIGVALIYVGDAIREAAQQPANAAKLRDAAPTAEALTLLMRAAQATTTTDNARSEQ